MIRRAVPFAVNAHTHLYSGLAPFGLPDLDPPAAHFLDILRRRWWRLDRALGPETLSAAARYAAATALLCGTTTLIDHHESPSFIEGSLDILAAACDTLGARALLCYGVTERNFGREEARRGLDENRRFIESRRAVAPSGQSRVRGAVGIHASFTVSDETLREAGELARSLKVPVHVHVAEDRADVLDAQKRGFPGPLERLLSLGALPPGSILAHGVHLTCEQVKLAMDHGLWIVHNPRSNAANRVGYAGSLAHASRVALGTDGFPSDMSAERDALAREAQTRKDPLTDPEARLTAGRALAEELFGAPSVQGDRVCIQTDSENERIRDVDVAGEPTVRDHALVRADFAEITAIAKENARALWAQMEKLP